MSDTIVRIHRGVPGSGKSYAAGNLKGTVHICCADDYHYVDGEYCWHPDNVKEAHNRCYASFHFYCMKYAQSKEPVTIVVANTNIHLWEITPYLRVAEFCGLPVEVHRYRARISTCVERQKRTHNVPENVILRMMEEFEPLPHFLGEEQTHWTD